MKYRHFLLDLDDTLLDFGASEKLSFEKTMHTLGLGELPEKLFEDYQSINKSLWDKFEQGLISKELLKVERFQRLFEMRALGADAGLASTTYLANLPECVVVVDGALELCKKLNYFGKVGIITNGIEAVQKARIAVSGLLPWLSFIATSEAYGYAKPDARFFDHAAVRFSEFNKSQAVIIGDRIEADIQGGHNFGIDSCWFNQKRVTSKHLLRPTYEVTQLDQVVDVLRTASSSL
ncbi:MULTISPECIES: YjjG family noncanonical pyrimidine nucleotidase [Xanthomonas]|uniref:Noncanonical pyrimidine nucleotidase, YjjG family n=2 Tax=Xanthomonas TaxID=338 RepID=A0AB33F502_XANCI|nr:MULTISPECIES: YjjG family noncanonical pyrimidine nucleotidase [Xanthomonas]ATS38072.1 YjjG family noncanonical pyrimidine nucleotidase [Xanthomonas citri pv. phaseoli var. fuscans]ATS43123.1 YjjG family noncanonical pyrimidine nucleotidase [Xanthomonas citri pv. phaseoli var. fuscans]ATS46073.1 YjjG family noncanonical pyrimidine nucleotidase [Xanthomonas citri pv. phaseoli var. fuscans]ATS83668.1 YjjG family noncanonical pyrimidine nucleotidase [Xanthomonas citri pv. phaseoli var. fuscans]